jgi:hypothetical protein
MTLEIKTANPSSMNVEVEDYDLQSSGVTLPVVYLVDGEVHNVDILLDNLFEHVQQKGYIEFYDPVKQQAVTRLEDYRFDWQTGEVIEVQGKCNTYDYKEWLRECAPIHEILLSFFKSKIQFKPSEDGESTVIFHL